MPTAPLPPTRVSRRDALRLGALLTCGFTLAACDSRKGSGGQDGEHRVFRFAQGAPAVSLDPALAPVTSTTRITSQILEPLVAANHYTGEPEPALATSWDISDDRRTYTFTLRENVKFSDGAALNTGAVLRNADRWRALATNTDTAHLCVPLFPLYGWGFGTAEKVETKQQSPSATPTPTATGSASPAESPQPTADPTASASAEPSASASGAAPHNSTQEEHATYRHQPLLQSVEEREGKIVMTLSRPSLAFLRMLTQPAFGILSPNCLDENSRIKDHPVGTGAFKVQSFDQARTVLVRNEHFKRDNTKVELDEIQFHTLSSSDKRYYSLVASKIDACDQVSRNDLAPLVREGYLTPTRDPFSLVYFDFNLEHPVLKNISVRRAIARAVERGTIVPYYLQGTSDALGYLPALFRTRDEDLLKPYYRRDTGTAQSLLAAANYKNEAIECYYPVDVSLPWMSTPQVIYSQLIGSLIEVGLNIKPVPLGWAEYCEKARSNGAERGMVLGGFYGAYRDPYAFLGPVLAPLLVAQWLNEKDPNRAKALPQTAQNPVSSTTASASPQPSASASASASPSASESESASPSASPAEGEQKQPSPTPSPTPTVKPAHIDPAPSLEQIMRDIRDADSAENVEDQRSKYRQVSTLLAQYMPGVPLMNVTSNVALSRDVRGYVTEQNAIEYFTKITVA